MLFKDKTILITGGTGSLGKVLLRRLLKGDQGQPKRIVVFSRDEAKQNDLRLEYQHGKASTDEVIYRNFMETLVFRIGDVRDYSAVCTALHGIDIVFNAAALKQVPTCEYFPFEAVQTNIVGPENIVRAIRDLRLPVEIVVGVSTDKAVKPVNVMGMTKALQERVFLRANLEAPQTKFVAVRYGNVLASRGSVIPLFHEQIRNGGPLTITHAEMTRFLLSLDEAVDTIFAAVRGGRRGETYIPRVPAARITDLASVLIGSRPIKTVVTGIRPGEKLHEILISEDEAHRTLRRGDYYVVGPILPELAVEKADGSLQREYSSADDLMSRSELEAMLRQRQLLDVESTAAERELLR